LQPLRQQVHPTGRLLLNLIFITESAGSGHPVIETHFFAIPQYDRVGNQGSISSCESLKSPRRLCSFTEKMSLVQISAIARLPRHHRQRRENCMQVLTREQGVFELTLLNAEHAQGQLDDIMVEGLALGIPAEVMTRLESLWSVTKTIVGEVIAIGRIIVTQLFAFLRAHPSIAIGVVLGAAVGALTAGIPFIGPLLAPIAASASILSGAAIGATVDAGAPSSDPLVAVTQLARSFFELLQSIFLAVRDYYLAD
jgi:hypothetical protein